MAARRDRPGGAARVLPLAAELDRARGAELTGIHLAALSWGKGTGIGVRVTGTQSLRLLAVAAGSNTELPGQVSCTKSRTT